MGTNIAAFGHVPSLATAMEDVRPWKTVKDSPSRQQL